MSCSKRDVDYIVKDGEVIIVDEFTGRTMEGRRYSDGLHQALEAKENVKIERENQTYASITFQNYFRMYKKLAGMTGTADTEGPEFKKIYNLDVVVMPTHMPMIRMDYADVIYKNEAAKYRAVIKEIKELHEKGQPVLVGTISIDVSEKISGMLKKEKVEHEVLNAKQHDREAEIIAGAGQLGGSPSPPTWPVEARTSSSDRGLPKSADSISWERPARVPADRQPVARPFRPSG